MKLHLKEILVATAATATLAGDLWLACYRYWPYQCCSSWP